MVLPCPIITTPSTRAPKGIVHGPPGCGKTTFGAGANGVIVDCENGIPQGAAWARTPYLPTWPAIRSWLDALTVAPDRPGVLVIDTIDWLLRRLEEHVAGVDGDESNMTATLNRSHGGYGNGKQVLRNHVYQWLLPTLDRFVLNGTAVLLLAHSTRRVVTNADGLEVERTYPDIHADLCNTMIEWSDFVGAAVVTPQQRIMVLTESPQIVAKNRYGINDPVNLKWSDFMAAAFPAAP